MRKNKLRQITLALWIFGSGLLLGVVFLYSDNSHQWTAQYHYLNLALLGIMLPAALTLATCPQRVFNFSFPEAGMVILMSWFFLSSFLHGPLSFGTLRFWFLIQCGIMGLLLRIGIRAFPSLQNYIHWLILLVGLVQALWGYAQLLGLRHSNHSHFALTGTFHNPGPYSGYLAVAFTVGVGLFLSAKKTNFRYLLTCSLLLIGGLLPAGMSRSAWLASAMGCASIFLTQYGFIKKGKTYFKTGKRIPTRKLIIGLLSTVSLLFVISLGLYTLRQESANGRLFIWKLTTHLIAEAPWTGHGLNSFPAKYGETQELYFSTHAGKEWEKQVAGTPEYAFNEYLHFAVEGGIPWLAGLLLFTGLLLYQNRFKENRVSTAGILTLGVFAFFSYPLQIPAMIILLILLLAGCGSSVTQKRFSGARYYRFGFYSNLLWIVCSGCLLIFLYPLHTKKIEALHEWDNTRYLYQAKAYEMSLSGYSPLYESLPDHPDFLFEYAMCLRHTGKYRHSNTLLEQALQYSGDPMILNLLGRNYESLGDLNPRQRQEYYTTSESYLLRSVHRLPDRLYPYYLLVKLYSNPSFYNPELRLEMANKVLHTQEKIPSPAVDEMRKEVKKLLYP